VSNISQLKNQIEQDRKSEVAAVNRRFDALLKALDGAYEITDISSRPRKPKKEPSSPDVHDTLPAPKTVKEEEDEAYEMTERFRDINTLIREHLLDGQLSKSELINLTGEPESVILYSLKHMIQSGQVIPVGEKRGRKYALAPIDHESTGKDEAEEAETELGNEAGNSNEQPGT
jgi:hypothetical protein